jgi:hypothetical protein
MNDSCPQQVAQRPSPATGSRQAAHKVGKATSRMALGILAAKPWQARQALRSRPLGRVEGIFAAVMGRA